ncbi:MAG: hypothetical protein KatS3mg114_0119 [Planctomycetaceae bacterium]|nr:MAG: hypothetical protein KatS3mg114_0119 [Planctomycetaceae bacterium]
MSWLPYVTMFLLAIVGLFMIFLILLQRGRGGGLAGALGGMGGTSAFGTRAGDIFTRITIVVAVIWVALAAINVWVLGSRTTRFKGGSEAVPRAPALQPSGDRESQASPSDQSLPSTTETKPEGDPLIPPSASGPETTTTPQASDAATSTEATTPASKPSESQQQSDKSSSTQSEKQANPGNP